MAIGVRSPSMYALVHLELRRELGSRESLQAGALLAGLILLLDMLILGDGAATVREAALILWLPLALGAATLAARAWARDADRGSLDLLRSLPVSLSSIAAARLLVQALLLAALVAAHLVAARYVFGIPVTVPVAATISLGAAGLLVLGSLCGALAAQSRAREALLPLLFIPLAAPLLVAGGSATIAALEGVASRTGLLLVAGYDLMVLGISWLLWPVLLESE